MRSFSAINIALIVLIATSPILGQTYEISGVIKDDAGKKVPNARITLYNKKLFLLRTERAKGNGKFKLRKVPPAKYTLNMYGPGGYALSMEVDLRSSAKTNLTPFLPGINAPQLTDKSEQDRIIITWDPMDEAAEYIIYKNNKEIKRTTKPNYEEIVPGGKSFGYNVVAIKNDGEKSARSLTEYGKALLGSPKTIKARARQNTVTLSWDPIENASGYNIYRDDDLINSTSETEYTDYKLKYNEEYSYSVVSTDHHQEEGPKSNSQSIKTHQEIKKIKKLKAEAGESVVGLQWVKHELAVKYRIYQNGTLIDSVKTIKYSAKTDPGSENCFTVSAVDKHGSEGPQSVPACDKAQYPPPEKITLDLGEKYTDDMNSITITWDPVDGPGSYNIYRDGKSLTNSKKTTYVDKDLDYGTQYTYEISSLSDDGLEGPLSEPAKEKTPSIYKINGQLINEKGQQKIEEAKVFLYTADNILWEEYTAGSKGKFTFENRIIAGKYMIKAFGNGHGNNGEYAGNGGINVTVKNKDENVKIKLSTDGLRPKMAAKRGVQRVLVKWKALPHAESYSVYKNDKSIAEKIKDTKYIDNVAPGKFYEYHVRAWDL